ATPHPVSWSPFAPRKGLSISRRSSFRGAKGDHEVTLSPCHLHSGGFRTMVVPSGEPDSHSPKPKRKKPIRNCSPEKYASCIANSKRSTGPVSILGKAAVSANAVQGGFTCTNITFLPGESIEEFYAEVGRWARRLNAEGPAEMHQIE